MFTFYFCTAGILSTLAIYFFILREEFQELGSSKETLTRAGHDKLDMIALATVSSLVALYFVCLQWDMKEETWWLWRITINTVYLFSFWITFHDFGLKKIHAISHSAVAIPT